MLFLNILYKPLLDKGYTLAEAAEVLAKAFPDLSAVAPGAVSKFMESCPPRR